jgi:hypothetical protein
MLIPSAMVDMNDAIDIHTECAYQCRSSIILEYIELYPEILAKADDYSYLPLHVLLGNEASSIDIALMMIEKYPTALQHQNFGRWLPLHLECRHLCRSAIIARCIQLYPQALAMAEMEGDLPLHVLLWNKASSIDDALMMIEKYPAALRHRNRENDLPLHMECMYQCRSTLISKYIQLYPKA